MSPGGNPAAIAIPIIILLFIIIAVIVAIFLMKKRAEKQGKKAASRFCQDFCHRLKPLHNYFPFVHDLFVSFCFLIVCFHFVFNLLLSFLQAKTRRKEKRLKAVNYWRMRTLGKTAPFKPTKMTKVITN